MSTQSVLAEPITVSDWQKNLDRNLEANLQKTNELLNLERTNAHLRKLRQGYSEYYFLNVKLAELKGQIEKLRTEIDSSLFLNSELSSEEFARLLNLISANCGVSINDGKLQIVQRFEGGGTKLIEIAIDKGTIQNVTRADIGPDDAIRFRDPKGFILTASTNDPKVAPWKEVIRLNLNIDAKMGPDHYAIEGSGFVVEGHLLTNVPWKSGERDSLTCYLKSEIQF